MSTIHLLIVADTKCHRIGESVVLDVRRVLQNLQEYASLSDMWLNCRILDGFDNQPPKIKQSVKELQVGVDDVIFLYYSGHGFRDSNKTDPFPFFYYGQDFAGNIEGFDSRVLYETLRHKCPRLLIFITDSCQEIVEGRKIKDHASYNTRRLFNDLDETKIANSKALFKESSGEVLLISCEPGELSKGNRFVGGIFSYGIFSALDETIAISSVSNPTWKDIAQEGSKRAAEFNPGQNAIWKFTNRDVFQDILNTDATKLDNWEYSKQENSGQTALNISICFDDDHVAQLSDLSLHKESQERAVPNQSKSISDTSASTVQCISCNAALRPGARFCTSCGTMQ